MIYPGIRIVLSLYNWLLITYQTLEDFTISGDFPNNLYDSPKISDCCSLPIALFLPHARAMSNLLCSLINLG